MSRKKSAAGVPSRLGNCRIDLGIDNEEEWQRLKRAIELTEGFALYLVSVQDRFTSDEVQLRLEESLPGRELVRLDMAKAQGPAIAWLLQQTAGHPPETLVALTGLDAKEMEPDFWRRFNERRNIWVRGSPHPQVWLINVGVRRRIREEAPDIYSVRSNDFLFTLAPVMGEAPGRETVASPVAERSGADELMAEAELFAEAQTSTGQTLYARALFYAAQQFLIEGRLEEGDGTLQTSLNVAERYSLSRVKAGILVLRGNLEQQLGKLEEAWDRYEEAMELSRGEDNIGLDNALKGLGELEQLLGKVDEARGRYEVAMGLYRGERDNLGLANALKGLGELEQLLGKVDEARGRYEEAMGLYRGERDNLGLANTLRGLGDLELRLGNVEEARERYEEAMGLYRRERSNLGQVNALRGWGNLEQMGGNHWGARSLYLEANELYTAEREPLGLAYTSAELARVCNALGYIRQMRQWLRQAREAADSSGSPVVQEYVQSVEAELTTEAEGK